MFTLDEQWLVALGLKSFQSGWRSVILLMLFAAALMVISALWTGHLQALIADFRRYPRKLVFWVTLAALYPVWAMVQQGIVFASLHGVRLVLPPAGLPWAAAITAMFFAAIHVPNYHLMFTVGFMVMLFSAHMDLHHNLAAIGIAHGVLATLWRLLSPSAVSTTLTVWGWYAGGQRELLKDLDAVDRTGKRWARAPAFRWFRLLTGAE